MSSKIEKYNKRLENLRSERSSFMSLWQMLSDFHLSHRGRFLTSDRNKGYQRNTSQYNNTSQMAVRTGAAGMMSGITSPSRPWFMLATPDPDLMEFQPVKEWLHRVQRTMYLVFAKSNIYNSLHRAYAELLVFGNGPVGLFDDFNSIIKTQSYTAGSYLISLSADDKVDTFYREYDRTVGQIVKQFGYENCSKVIKQQWDRGNSENWHTIVHAVEPNDDRDMMSPLAKDMPVRSVYYEKDVSNGNGATFLRESGFRSFPFMIPRWDFASGDVYATSCPGMLTIGDTKALQLGEKKQYVALDKLVDPPLQGPASIVNKLENGTVKGGDTIAVDAAGGSLASIYGNYRPDLGAMVSMNDRVEERIKKGFYEDLFLMLTNSDRRQITAREVAEKHEEKLLMLGPVLEQVHGSLLDPAIDLTFEKIQRAGVLPPPPPELDQVDLDVEYVSILAQAQRLVATGAIDRLAGYVGNIVNIWPEARHKFDASQSIDEYGHALGVNPAVIRSDNDAQAMVDAENQAAQQQAAQAQVMEAAQMAKIASETDVQGDNALTRVSGNL